MSPNPPAEAPERPVPIGKDAEVLLEMESRLLGNVAHSLRSPLVAIRGYARMALEACEGKRTSQTEYLRAVLENADKLGEIAADVARLAEAVNLRLEPVELRGLVASSRRSLECLARERGVRLVEQPLSNPLVLAGDRVRLERALACFLTHALKLSCDGEEIRIECMDARGDGGVKLRIIGSHSFEQSPQPERSASELLDACDIIRLHGGEIDAADVDGRAAFVLTLPVVMPHVASEDGS